jgi:pyruvate kinase
MSVARLNLSHGTLDSHTSAADNVRAASSKLDIPVSIMVDVPGPKYRTGPTVPGVINLEPGDDIVLTSRALVGDKTLICVTPPGIHRDADPGNKVMISDGLIQLRVMRIDDEDVICQALTSGRITEGRGVSIPGVAPSQPFPDEAARTALHFAADQAADFVALSGVTSDADVKAARDILDGRGVRPLIVSKIEMAEGVTNFESILEASDGIMVARGDLGVEVRLAEVPVIQKRLIRACNRAGKVVITATQMLESMISSPAPTRAEVTDVANAVFDGSDAIMLSGETSIGKYPIAAVEIMAEVAIEAEKALPYESILLDKREDLEHQTDDAIAYNACQTAHQLGASLIVAFTESGSTAGRVSKYRPAAQILALTPSAETQRALTMSWGVLPVTTAPVRDLDDFFARVQEEAVKVSGVASGSLVILVAGLPIGVPGGTNLLQVLSVD